MIDLPKKIGRVSALRREVRRKFYELGFWATLRLGGKKLIHEVFKLFFQEENNPDDFDARYGTDTGGIIRPGALDISEDNALHAVRYETAKSEVYLDILNSLTISYPEFLFVDMGCGKGRALLLASQFPFKEIIGIELSKNLHKIACRNIQIYREKLQQCHKIQSVCENAANYKIPDEKIVFYLFNPFDEHVMRSVLLNIERSLYIYPREIYIAYLRPVYRNVFDQVSFLEIVKETEKYLIYKSMQSELNGINELKNVFGG